VLSAVTLRAILSIRARATSGMAPT
jgi:hypothetical protein